MTIYGVGILAFCFILGQLIGGFLGRLINVDANVGGVGFAMLLLIMANEYFRGKTYFNKPEQDGIYFWSAMYIPIIVAMSATQNVTAALSGGFIAILAGSIPTLSLIVLVPIISRIGRKKS